ncbi:hypothetical protein FF011L_39750 [Roseimaritima multifibrata]|uniref:Uncharacterized protein n=1 Tax=Roseimaritima multifibrata TaxID=1930274 RepID=A0A517MJW5_9BACT|nr:hypothetical protein FF011L_39750 [Roseimaritima multifibrata]
MRGNFQAAILQRRRGESLGFQAVMPRLAQRCQPLSPSPSPQKQAFESHLMELAGEPLVQYQTCLRRACFEGAGSQTFFTYSRSRRDQYPSPINRTSFGLISGEPKGSILSRPEGSTQQNCYDNHLATLRRCVTNKFHVPRERILKRTFFRGPKGDSIHSIPVGAKTAGKNQNVSFKTHD